MIIFYIIHIAFMLDGQLRLKNVVLSPCAVMILAPAQRKTACSCQIVKASLKPSPKFHHQELPLHVHKLLRDAAVDFGQLLHSSQLITFHTKA